MRKHLSTNRVKAPEALENSITRRELAEKIQTGLQKRLMVLEAGAGDMVKQRLFVKNSINCLLIGGNG